MKLLNNGVYLFDKSFPIHTWYPILDGKELPNDELIFALENLDTTEIKERALYFHIPFCEKNICSFCTFPRKLINNPEEIDNYVECLIKEIELKSQYKSIGKVPVKSIFFGGGTPSVLTANHIQKLGAKIHENFDLSELKEWSFENNIQSITEDKLIALKSIGVTHVRAGVQSLNKKYRKYFDLVPTVSEVKEKVRLLKKHFENVCIDIIYGINGQTIDEFMLDVHEACRLDTKLIDFYPLTQPKGNMKLKNLFIEDGLIPKNEMQLLGFMMILREMMKNYGYAPHNGHGFVKSNDLDSIYTKEYVFEYHKACLGYGNGDVIGFGSGASSRTISYGFDNYSNVTEYQKALKKDKLPTHVFSIKNNLFYSKSISSHLPYFGYADKNKIDWGKIDNATKVNFEELLKAGVIIEEDEQYKLSQLGWYWNHVLSYYLSPEADRLILESSLEKVDRTLYEFSFGECHE